MNEKEVLQNRVKSRANSSRDSTRTQLNWLMTYTELILRLDPGSENLLKRFPWTSSSILFPNYETLHIAALFHSYHFHFKMRALPV